MSHIHRLDIIWVERCLSRLLRWRISHAFKTLPPLTDRVGVSARPRPAFGATTWIR